MKSASVWSHQRLSNLGDTQRTSVKIYLHKYCDFFQNTGKNCFRKKLIWKISQNIHPEETIKKSFLQLPHNLELHWKRSYFPMLFEKIFQNTVLCQKTGKATEGTEAFVRICLTKMLIWRISQNSSRRNFDGVLFSLSSSLQLFLKRTPSQLFSYVTEAIRVCLKCILKIFKISIN